MDQESNLASRKRKLTSPDSLNTETNVTDSFNSDLKDNCSDVEIVELTEPSAKCIKTSEIINLSNAESINLDDESSQEVVVVEEPVEIISLLSQRSENILVTNEADANSSKHNTSKGSGDIENETVKLDVSDEGEILDDPEDVLTENQGGPENGEDVAVEILNNTVPDKIVGNEIDEATTERVTENSHENQEKTQDDYKNLTNEENKCFIYINFSNDETKKKYKSKFLNFLELFPEFKAIEFENEIKLIPTENKIGVSDNESANSDKHKSKRKKGKKSKEKNDLFMLDTNPTHRNSDSSQHRPIYLSKFKTISEEILDQEENKATDSAIKVCFNCDGNHVLRDCPLPKNFAKINKQRSKKAYNSRYHLEEEQKFSHLKPGQISDRLRSALGLSRHAIPPFIYKMRVMGYPPGWLEEAKNVQSNLSIIDGDGNETNNTNEPASFDFDKIVDYPGFNCRPHRDACDNFDYFRVPAYTSALNKQNMIEHLSKVTKQQQQIHDQISQRNKDLRNQQRHVDSPSLIDLEEQKKNLLNQLSVDSSVEIVDLDDDKNQDDLNVTPNNFDQSSSNLEQTPVGKNIKFSMVGTPILKSLSPYSSLPNPGNFSKDVSPLINFENLPNSTGKYEQMSSVLDKVRRALKGQSKT